MKMKTVRVAFSGQFDIEAADIDGVAVPLDSGKGSAQLQTGRHRLGWRVRGRPGGKYSLALSGAAKMEFKDMVIPSDGEDVGSEPFDVQ